jgi:hypothetical protein
MKIKISRNGQEIGDWTEEEVKAQYAEGKLVDSDYYWTEGMPQWGSLATLMGKATPPPTPPAAPVAEVPATPFFSVSLLKLAVLSLVTFALYDVYWAWQNWRAIQARDPRHKHILPFWRGFFGFIWIYPLLREVRTMQEATGLPKEKTIPAGPLAVAWIGLTLLYKLPGGWFFLSFLSIIPLLAMQSHINRLNSVVAPHAPVNSRFTWANWIWIVVGIIWLALAIYGSTLPDNN